MLNRDCWIEVVRRLERAELLRCICVSRLLRELCLAQLERAFGYYMEHFASMPRMVASKRLESVLQHLNEVRPHNDAWLRFVGGRMVGKISLQAAMFSRVFYEDTQHLKEPMLSHPTTRQFVHNDETFRVTDDYSPDCWGLPPVSTGAEAKAYGNKLFADDKSCFFVVFDQSDTTTLFEARFFLNWICSRQENFTAGEFPIPAVLIGNKADLARTGKGEMFGKQLAKLYGIPFVGVSCKQAGEENFDHLIVLGSQMVNLRSLSEVPSKKCIVC